MSIVIIGAAGHGREVAAAANAAAKFAPAWANVTGFLDDDAALIGRVIGALTIKGSASDDSIRGHEAVLGVGYPEAKARIIARLGTKAVSWPTLVHPMASVGERVVMARGCFVQAGCVLTCDIDLAEFVTVNVGATISHDVRVGRLATVSPGAHIGGTVSIGEGAFIGIGASVKQGITIGAWSVVGAGAAVVDDVPANAVVAGVPARVIKQQSAGWQIE